MMKKQLLIILFLVLGQNAFAQNYESFEELKNEIISKSVPLISVAKLRQMGNTENRFLIFDAREKEEFDASHIKGAKYVGYDNFNLSKLKDIDKNTTVVVYCAVGYRSEKIGEKLQKAGFTKVMNLQGGIFDWVNSGYPVYDNDGNETQKVHGYNKYWGKWLTRGEKVYE